MTDMLLQHLYEYAHSRNLLGDPAFYPTAIRWIINLDSNGNLLGSGPLDTAENGTYGKIICCPWTLLMDNSGKISEFLYGSVDSVFGLSPDPGKPKDPKKLQAKCGHFWQQINECSEHVPIMYAVLKFKSALGPNQPSFILEDGNGWIIISSDGTRNKIKSGNFTFCVDGKILFDDDNVRDWWRKRFNVELSEIKSSSQNGICIATGLLNQPVAETHNVKIMNVPGGQGSGASLVSFDKSAFSSYGFNKSHNCPTSVDAMLGYCLSLNHIIQSRNTSLRLGNTLFCFWVRDTCELQDFFADMLDTADPLAIEEFIKSPWAGIEREVAEKDKFISVTLVGNAGRVVVKHWMQQTLLQAVGNFKKWFDDLSVCHITVKSDSGKTSAANEKTKKSHPLSVYRLAATMAPPKKKNGLMTSDMDKLQTDALSQLYRAALENATPSISLVKPILDQLHSRLVGDDNYEPVFDQSRFAFLKLILNRNRKATDMEIQTKLTADTGDSAYNSGRLLAVLSETQKKAHEYKLEGAGVTERYFGMASVSPASVFPLLLRLNRHHLDKIRKSDKYGGHERYLEGQIREILAKFTSETEACPPNFKRTLGLHEQGRFALGFYQQQAEDAARRSEAMETKEASKSPSPTN